MGQSKKKKRKCVWNRFKERLKRASRHWPPKNKKKGTLLNLEERSGGKGDLIRRATTSKGRRGGFRKPFSFVRLGLGLLLAPENPEKTGLGMRKIKEKDEGQRGRGRGKEKKTAACEPGSFYLRRRRRRNRDADIARGSGGNLGAKGGQRRSGGSRRESRKEADR